MISAASPLASPLEKPKDIARKQEIYDLSPSIFIDGALASSPTKDAIPAIRSLVLEVDRLTKVIGGHGGDALQSPERAHRCCKRLLSLRDPSRRLAHPVCLRRRQSKTIQRVQPALQSSRGVTVRQNLERDAAAAIP